MKARSEPGSEESSLKPNKTFEGDSVVPQENDNLLVRLKRLVNRTKFAAAPKGSMDWGRLHV